MTLKETRLYKLLQNPVMLREAYGCLFIFAVLVLVAAQTLSLTIESDIIRILLKFLMIITLIILAVIVYIQEDIYKIIAEQSFESTKDRKEHL
jgi:hypothetical protein